MSTRITKYEVGVGSGGASLCGGGSLVLAKNYSYPQYGFNSLITDRGYTKGDIIEQCQDMDNGHIVWEKKNGVEVYRYDAQAERERHDEWMKETLQAKGMNHAIYNP